MPMTGDYPVDLPAGHPASDPRVWVERYGDYLYRFALAKIRRPDEAEDIVQDTLLAAWRGRAEFAGRASERSWLTAILKRKVVDHLRRRVRERTDPIPDDRGSTGDPFNRWGKWKTPPGNWGQHGPGEELNREEFWATMHDCMGKLPRRLHDAFALRYLDERGAEDVCEDMGLTTTNLWVMLHRARLKMWQCLSENWFGHEPEGGEQAC
ncbi:sigma-70 family RNA polymerase sigma factor [Fimbriiglobus ruber]|uniref:RNA polymerase sigma factor n=1 Tax=Fimbriiglobus ruber TaxID=1908690 RepID=A0A225DZU2_9BACT|nr:sigma-70 family RNA polymerase sigma factor [Fimbriiglobus ruber]OWK47020.1 sigma factor [Fimbriiglobus ruber]